MENFNSPNPGFPNGNPNHPNGQPGFPNGNPNFRNPGPGYPNRGPHIPGGEPVFTLHWLGLRVASVLITAVVLSIIVSSLDSFALGRQEHGLLPGSRYDYFSEAISYCFAVLAITGISITLIEVIFRKVVNYLQYGLIGCALCLFNLLLLAMAEHMSFFVAFVIVAAMTAGLISLFIKGITLRKKAMLLCAAILAVEYGLILVLLCMGSMALLIGSLSLFILIAVAMYFTLKLKIENDELVLK